MSILPASSSGEVSTGFYNGVATQSLRFNDASQNYLTRTPASAGSRTTWTWSGWFKIGTDPSLYHNLFTSNTNYDQIRFDPAGRIIFGVYTSGGAANAGTFTTKQRFRDCSNWYHFGFVWDTSNATAGDRQRMYVNGIRILNDDLTVTTTPSLNAVSNFNNEQMSIGRRESTNALYMDGYLSEVNFLDGIAVSHTQNSAGDYVWDEFGEFKNGVWIPKAYTGSYGTNGFRLEFKQTGDGSSGGSSTTRGADTSGNNNHFQDLNFGADHANLPDCPENNFMTFNPLHYADTSSLSNLLREGSLHAHCDSDDGIFTTMEIPTSGKWYVEILFVDASKPMGCYILGNRHETRDDWTHASNYTSFLEGFSIQGSTNKVFEYGGSEIGGAGSHSANTIYAFLIDVDNSTYDIYQNDSKILDAGSFNHPGATIGAILGMGNNSDSGTNDADFRLNAGQDSSFQGTITSGSSNESDANGIGDFYYSTKGGLALCSANLPDTTLSPDKGAQADDHFNTVLYTGDGQSTNDITGVGFKPDWTWIKERFSDGSHVASHVLVDSSRGYENFLVSAENQAESSGVTGNNSTRSSDGFQTTNSGASNQSGQSYVAWNWLANGGTTSSNTSGDITSTVQVNDTAGFSIILYTGFGEAVKTVGHGLSKAPELILFKTRNTAGAWFTYHKEAGNNGYLRLDDETVFTADSNFLNNTTPSNTLITLGVSSAANAESQPYVAYAFYGIEGYSKFGKYEGNGSTDGTFVYLGFRPAFVIIKTTSQVNQYWIIKDNKRGFNDDTTSKSLYANVGDAEASGNIDVDLVSNGMKMRDGGSNINNNGQSYVYIAFADQPFKFSNAR